MTAPVAIAMVTHDSAADLPDALAAIARLAPAPAELVVVDCASRDGSAEIARRQRPASIAGRVVALEENLGFAGGTNRAIAASTSPWILTLNADALPAPDYLARLLELAANPRAGRVGAVTGRLVRPGEPRRLDACGMRLTRAWRHFDRGSGELDRGQYAAAERVFGATGAASLWSRSALADVAVESGPFDERFHSYREDAELSFRLRRRGWEVLYAPTAIAVHHRRVVPAGRRGLPAAINFHSLKNRYLLRCAHQTAGNFWRTLPWTAARDLGALVWVLLVERESLPAYAWLWRRRRELAAHRRALRARSTVAVERWFTRRGEPL